MDGTAYNFECAYVPPQLHSLTFQDLGKLILELPPGILVVGGGLQRDAKQRHGLLPGEGCADSGHRFQIHDMDGVPGPLRLVEKMESHA